MKVLLVLLSSFLIFGSSIETEKFCLPVDIEKCTRKPKKFGIDSSNSWRVRMYGPSAIRKGIDFILPTGENVYASHSGKVMYAHDSISGFGKKIEILNKDSIKTYYCHLSEILVETNQDVKCGELIGKVGNTGMCVAPMLHVRMYEKDSLIDPETYLVIPELK